MEAKILVVRSMEFGITKTGMMINGVRYWHFKKGDFIGPRGSTPAKMQDDGALILYPDGPVRITYNSLHDEAWWKEHYGSNESGTGREEIGNPEEYA